METCNLAAGRTPTAAEKMRAAEVIQRQLADGRKVLAASPTPEKIRVSSSAYGDAERLFAVNKLTLGARPPSVSPDSVKELMAAGVLERTGHARSTRYKLAIRPQDLVRDDSLSRRHFAGSGARATSGVERRAHHSLQIDDATRAYIRENVREYLAFATSMEARKHEEKRQSENILDVIHARAKEIVRLSKAGHGPKVLPVTAIAIAQEELAEDFETRLRRRWRPIMFELFGIEETVDTSMRDMREGNRAFLLPSRIDDETEPSRS